MQILKFLNFDLNFFKNLVWLFIWTVVDKLKVKVPRLTLEKTSYNLKKCLCIELQDFVQKSILHCKTYNIVDGVSPLYFTKVLFGT